MWKTVGSPNILFQSGSRKSARKSSTTSPQKLLILHIGNDGGPFLSHTPEQIGQLLVRALKEEPDQICRGHGNAQMMHAADLIKHLDGLAKTGLKLNLHHLKTGQAGS